MPEASTTTAPVPALAPAPKIAAAPSAADSGTTTAPDDRMVVRTGDLAIVVDDIIKAIDSISKTAASLPGGYVVTSQTWRENERLRGSISIRVPAGSFDNVMESIARLAVEVTTRNSTSKDVTEEYTDLSARLKNLEAAEAQLVKIMASATKVEDVLAVQRELTRVRGEIESTKARMLYLQRTSDTSLISVRLEQAKMDIKFTASLSTVKAGESVRFSPQIAGGFSPYSYQWDFGDGVTATEPSPSHTYNSAGSYTVTLTVTDNKGNTASQTRKDYVTVLPGWTAGGAASSAWNGLVVFSQMMITLLIWLAIFSPVWIIIGGVTWWLVRRSKKQAK